jgi:hypothetical protein
MKPISTKQHAALDYMMGASQLVLARSLDASDGVTKMLRGSGMGILGMGALTRNELGLVRVLPMKAHLAADVVLGGAFLVAPLLFADEDDRVKSVLAGIGAMATVVTLLTRSQTSSSSQTLEDEALPTT